MSGTMPALVKEELQPTRQWKELKLGAMATLPGLQSFKTSDMLDQVDKVRANGLGDHVFLPQIAVFGDQSAGKSSVLERVTGIQFPRKEGLCTRFPTEIILRDEPGTDLIEITATIVPSGSRSGTDKDRLKQFHRKLSGFDGLPSLIEDAASLMGIDGYSEFVDSPMFAADVLRLKVVGATGLNLTVVDIPGLISGSENDQDMQIVDEMVDSYLKSSRTLILAVVQATADIDTQSIIQRARRFDKHGERTVGIITKPDMVNKGTEARVAMSTLR